MEIMGSLLMNRRKFLKKMFYTTAGLYMTPLLGDWHLVDAALNVQVKESYLQFTSLTNRTVTDMIVMHHIGGSNREVTAAEVHQWHLNNGWAGIGYHYLIHQDGTIERGRPRDTIGAHCYGENDHTIGINVVGEFDGAWPTAAQLDSAARLLAVLCQIYRLHPDEGTIVGHRDLSSTACPGQHLYDLLPDIRKKTATLV